MKCDKTMEPIKVRITAAVMCANEPLCVAVPAPEVIR